MCIWCSACIWVWYSSNPCTRILMLVWWGQLARDLWYMYLSWWWFDGLQTDTYNTIHRMLCMLLSTKGFCVGFHIKIMCVDNFNGFSEQFSYITTTWCGKSDSKHLVLMWCWVLEKKSFCQLSIGTILILFSSHTTYQYNICRWSSICSQNRA